jgi:UDP:flavonoid glycosyltransferase YjiC (YdhE family)
VKITMIAVGTRGDVQPAVALGLGLHAAGHEIRVAAHPGFEPFVRARGLDFAPLAEGTVSRGRQAPTGRGWRREMLRDARSVAARRLADCVDACDDAEAIVVSVLGTLLGYQLAEHRQVPLVRAYTAPFGSDRPAGGLGRARDRLVRQAVWLHGRRWVNAARRDVLALPRLPARDFLADVDARRVLLLYGYSPAVAGVPDPREWVHATGYWFLDRPTDWEPPRRLVEFLGSGPPPVFVGFSGRRDRAGEATGAAVLAALARTGTRAVVQAPLLAEADDLPPDVLPVESIPHDWLFPRLAAAVHHGGAGTTAAALRAGLPSVVVPDFADEPFWARRVHELGLGPAPIPRRLLSAVRLGDAIRSATTDAGMRERAVALAERIRPEDGVARAVEAFEHHVASARVSRCHDVGPRGHWLPSAGAR